MPIQPMRFSPISFAEANPELVGAQSGQDLISNALKIYQQQMANQQQSKLNPLELYLAQIKAQYAEPMAQSGLQEKAALAEKNKQDAARLAYYQKHPALWGSGIGKDIETLQIAKEQAQQAQQASSPNNQLNVVRSMLNKARPDQEQNLNYTAMPGQGIPGIENAQQQAQQIPQLPQSQKQIQTLENMPWYSDENINNLTRAMIKSPELVNQSREALLNQRQNKLMGQSFDLQTPAEKATTLGQAKAAGFSSDEAIDLFHKGKKLPDLMEMAGYDRNDPNTWPEAKYAPSTQDITNIHTSGAANAALEVLNPIMTKGLTALGPTFFGLSPKMFFDRISGMNENDQVDAIVAYVLGPEYQTMRQNALHLRTGIGALKHFEEKGLTGIKGITSFMTPRLYELAQARINNTIKDMNQMQNQYYKQQGIPRPKGDFLMSPNKKGTTNGNANTSAMVHMISPDGKEYDVPEDKVDLFTQNNFKRVK